MNEDSTDRLDEQLKKARRGERAALTLLVQAHQRSVYSLALRMLGTRDLAEDLTQEVFMQMNGNLSTIDSNRHLGFWLRQVTTHRAIDQLRRRARIQTDAIKKFRAATAAGKMTFQSANAQKVAIPLSFKGFGPAYDALLKQ